MKAWGHSPRVQVFRFARVLAMDGGSSLDTHASLIWRLKQTPNDDLAWREFVARYGPHIRSWCLRWHVQEADADDVAQDVLRILAGKIRRFEYDPSRSFRAYLKTVTLNALRDHLAGNPQGTAGAGDTRTLQLLESVQARADLLEQLKEAFDLELLEVAAARVKQRVEQRTWEAFRLTALEGISGAEAAAQLAMPVASVFKAKSNVQRLLREALQELEKEP